MRFLHTADLHIGKMLNDVSLLQDQQTVLSQIVNIAAEKKVDGVLIAGDVYQRAAPTAEAMAVFDEFVRQLTEQGQKVFVISGNHDSMLRIAYLSRLVRGAGLYVSEAFEGSLQQITLQDQYGPLTIHLLPFIRPMQVKRFFPDRKIVSYQDAVQAVLESAVIDRKQRNILLCHQFITGSETCDSEEKSIGGLDNIDASVFDAFDYVALGHIHKAQKCARETLRYAGSPLKYSFSEMQHKKSVVIVDIEEKGEITLKTEPLYSPRDVRAVRGKMDQLMRMDYSEDLMWVTLTDEDVLPDARQTLNTVFPHILKFSIENSKTKLDMDVLAQERMEDRSVTDLFCDFYRLQNNDRLPDEQQLQLLEKVLKELEMEEK